MNILINKSVKEKILNLKRMVSILEEGTIFYITSTGKYIISHQESFYAISDNVMELFKTTADLMDFAHNTYFFDATTPIKTKLSQFQYKDQLYLLIKYGSCENSCGKTCIKADGILIECDVEECVEAHTHYEYTE